jgi:hypothetical protein
MVSVKNFHRSARARPPPADTPDESSAVTTSQVTPSIHDFAVSLPATAAARLTAAYQPVSAHLNSLFRRELDDGQADHRDASAGAARVTGLIIGAAVLGIVIGLLVLWHGIRRIRRNLEPGQDQAEFAETLQIAGDEDEAHRLLQRHLERTLPATSATVLNRNNSADRLEAVTPLPPGSPLAPRTMTPMRTVPAPSPCS